MDENIYDNVIFYYFTNDFKDDSFKLIMIYNLLNSEYSCDLKKFFEIIDKDDIDIFLLKEFPFYYNHYYNFLKNQNNLKLKRQIMYDFNSENLIDFSNIYISNLSEIENENLFYFTRELLNIDYGLRIRYNDINVLLGIEFLSEKCLDEIKQRLFKISEELLMLK